MKLWICALLALALLSGCAPQAAEPEGTALVQVLGVDGGGPVTLTAVCPGQQGAEPVVGSATAADFAAARAKLPAAGERALALTNLSYLIVNREADLREVLFAVLEDGELSPAATVWCTGDAAELLENCGDAAGRLAVLEASGVEAPTVADALAQLESFGAVRLPRLEWNGGAMTVEGGVLWNSGG